MADETFTTSSSGDSSISKPTSAATPSDRKIDFVDTIIFTSIALGIDATGLIPVVGEVCSPLGIGGFRLLFWFKGVNSPLTNWLSLGTGGAEAIPALSEVLPGCTAYVLTICLTEQFSKQIGQTAETIAKVSPEPETKLAAMGVATAAKMQQGQSVKEAVGGQVANTAGGGAGTGGATRAPVVRGQTTGATVSMGSEESFNGGFDLGGQATDEERSQQPGGEGIPAANINENAGALGSPLVEGQPQASDGAETTIAGSSQLRRLDEARKARERARRQAA